MLDYNIEDAQRILKSFDSVDLRLDNHILDNWFEREINLDYIFDCFAFAVIHFIFQILVYS